MNKKQILEKLKNLDNISSYDRKNQADILSREIGSKLDELFGYKLKELQELAIDDIHTHLCKLMSKERVDQIIHECDIQAIYDFYKSAGVDGNIVIDKGVLKALIETPTGNFLSKELPASEAISTFMWLLILAAYINATSNR